MKKLMMTTVCLFALSLTPALAQTKAPSPASGTAKSAADCQANFMSADKNNDGQLDKAEVEASKIMVPTTLSTAGMILMQDFVSACSATVVETAPRK
jgi:Ca2+-binding EF-hand superfamily protein